MNEFKSYRIFSIILIFSLLLSLPLFLIFVWHTEIFMLVGNTDTLTNGFITITGKQMYHILMYLCLSLYTIQLCSLGYITHKLINEEY